nr:hypothetical protein [uncultured Celeribacter sp.]
MYESRSTPPISPARFRKRLFLHVLVAGAVVLGSAGLGTLGYVGLEGMSWQRALLNATIQLSGLGLAEVPGTGHGQIFASLFALYSGFVFLAVSSIVVAPILHRLLHKFHYAETDSHES